MSQSKNFNVGVLALALLVVIPFQSNLARADESSPLIYISPGIKFSFHVKAYIKAGDVADIELSGAPDSLCEIYLPGVSDHYDATVDVDIAGVTGGEMTPDDSHTIVGEDFQVNGKPTDITLTCENTTVGGFMNFIKSIGGKTLYPSARKSTSLSREPTTLETLVAQMYWAFPIAPILDIVN